jgi:hypothetical protein
VTNRDVSREGVTKSKTWGTYASGAGILSVSGVMTTVIEACSESLSLAKVDRSGVLGLSDDIPWRPGLALDGNSRRDCSYSGVQSWPFNPELTVWKAIEVPDCFDN